MKRAGLSVILVLAMLATVLPSLAAAEQVGEAEQRHELDAATATKQCLLYPHDCLRTIWDEYTCWGLECEPYYPFDTMFDCEPHTLLDTLACLRADARVEAGTGHCLTNPHDCLEPIWDDYTCWDLECNPQYPFDTAR